MKFNPKFGDTIVCNNGRQFTCVANPGITDCSIYGETSNGAWQDWNESGFAGGFEDEDTNFNIKEIIPAEGTEPCKITEPDLEFKLRVLQKENEFLTRLLLKEGKL